MLVEEICSHEVIVARLDDTVIEAANRMRETHVGTLVVVDDDAGFDAPIGMLTDRDLVVSVLAKAGDQVPKLLVGDVYHEGVITCAMDDDIWVASTRMREHGIRRLPVVDTKGELIGIVALDDVLSEIVEELNDLVEVVRGQRYKERVDRP